jgi:hypothetical protein
MPAGKGYWFVTHNFDLIDIVEHESYLRDLSSAMWTNASSLGPREYAQAATLGMKEGRPWLESVPRETPAARRERWLKAAMKKGWVRVRQAPNRVMVFEAWKVNDDLLASLGVAVKQLELSPETPIEIHEVSSDRPRSMTAGDLRAYLAGEESPAEGEIGFSVYSNPGGQKLSHIRGREFGCGRSFPAGITHVAGRFRTTLHGNWNPLEEPRLIGRFMQMNPRQLRRYVDTERGEGETVARIFLGLKVGVGKHVTHIAPLSVYDWVQKFRRKQLGGEAPGGASFIAQKGYFTHWDNHPAGVVDEDSLQIIFYPDGRPGQSCSEFDSNNRVRGEVFAKHMHALAPALADAFNQKEVIIHLIVNGKLDTLGSY